MIKEYTRCRPYVGFDERHIVPLENCPGQYLWQEVTFPFGRHRGPFVVRFGPIEPQDFTALDFQMLP